MKMNRRSALVGGGALLLANQVAQAAGRRSLYEQTEVALCTRSLHELHDGLRVVQLSDLHVGHFTPDERIRSAVRQTNLLAPDLVVLTGDFVTTRRDPIERVAELLQGLKAPTVAVLGNHDHWTQPRRLREDLERCGYAVLQNERTTVRLKGADLVVFGVDDGRTRHDDVPKTFAGASTSGSRLVLTHTPSTADRLPQDEDVVCLAGHTHGGQVFIPGLTGGLFRLGGERYLRGDYRVRGNTLYVNRGLGIGGPMPRLGSPPELALLTLRRSEPEAPASGAKPRRRARVRARR